MVETFISLTNEEKRRQTFRDVKRPAVTGRKGYSPGIPPRGYMAVKVVIGEKRDGVLRIVSKWEPDQILSEYVKIAWQMRAQGKSYREITDAIQESSTLATIPGIASFGIKPIWGSARAAISKFQITMSR